MELVPENWEPDIYAGLIFFCVEIVLIVLLLPFVLRLYERRKDRRLWMSARRQMLDTLADTCVEVRDAMNVLDWATRSWIQHRNGDGRGAIQRAPIRGSKLVSVANEIDEHVKSQTDWSSRNYQTVIDLAALSILRELRKARTQIDTLAICINEDMTESVSRNLSGINNIEFAAQILLQHTGFFGERYDTVAPADNPRLSDLAEELRNQLGSEIGVSIRTLQPTDNSPKIVRADSITYASQVREIVQGFALMLSSVWELDRILQVGGKPKDALSDVATMKRQFASVCLAADNVANLFTDPTIREVSGVGHALELAPDVFVDTVLEDLPEEAEARTDPAAPKSIAMPRWKFDLVGAITLCVFVAAIVSLLMGEMVPFEVFCAFLAATVLVSILLWSGVHYRKRA